ncbi:MAG: molybdenum cofactor guanylyltransferase MobA [Pseudomonadota bacterium]
MNQPFGVILAGGLARRMGGGDKALLPLGDGVVMDHVWDRLAPQTGKVAINANGDPARWRAWNGPVLPDTLPDFPGPLAGVLAGMRWAAQAGTSHIVTVAGDTPFFPPDLVPQLLFACERQGKPIGIAATADGWHPTFGVWPVALADDLETELTGGMRKILRWAEKHGVAQAMFPTGDLDPFFNINTPDDLAAAQAQQ